MRGGMPRVVVTTMLPCWLVFGASECVLALFIFIYYTAPLGIWSMRVKLRGCAGICSRSCPAVCSEFRRRGVGS